VLHADDLEHSDLSATAGSVRDHLGDRLGVGYRLEDQTHAA